MLRLRNKMKVKEAIKWLEQMDEDLDVMITFGDIPNKNIDFPGTPSQPIFWPGWNPCLDYNPYPYRNLPGKPRLIC